MSSIPIPVESGSPGSSRTPGPNTDGSQAPGLPQRQRINLDGPLAQATRPVNGEVIPRKPKLANRNQFTQELVKITPICLRQRRTLYDRVQVLLVYWSDGQYQEMQDNAEAIGQMFHDDYHFKIEKVPLSNDKSSINLNLKMYAAMEDLSEASKQNLLIIFYCGHGVSDTDGRLLWKPEKDTSVELRWDKSQDNLLDADCDLLFLIDCCQASAMIKYGMKWKRRCELLGATSATEEALANEDFSFTTALIRFLQSKDCLTEGVSIDDLSRDLKNPENLTKKYGLVKEPGYVYHSGRDKRLSSIFLNPLTQTPRGSTQVVQRTVEQLDARTKKVMLMALMLADSAIPFNIEEWSKMISVAPHEVSSIDYAMLSVEEYNEVLSCVETQAVFKGSLVVIVSMPVWLWDYLEPNDSYRPIGFIRSGNLLQSLKESPADAVSATAGRISGVEIQKQKPIPKAKGKQNIHLQTPGRKNANAQFDDFWGRMPQNVSDPWRPADPTQRFPPARDIVIPNMLPPTSKQSPSKPQNSGISGFFRKALLLPGNYLDVMEATPDQYSDFVDRKAQHVSLPQTLKV